MLFRFVKKKHQKNKRNAQCFKNSKMPWYTYMDQGVLLYVFLVLVEIPIFWRNTRISILGKPAR